MDTQKRTWAEVHLENIDHNFKSIKASLPEKTRFLGVVKADAYGHGSVEVSKRLEKLGADYLAVSCLDEARELRAAGIKMPILILGHTPPEYVPELIEKNITQTVTCEAKALEYSTEAKRCGGTLKIHIKIDTGMSRLGFLTAPPHFDTGVKNVISAVSLPSLFAEGIYTHFAVSDDLSLDNESYTFRQFELFMSVIYAVEKSGGFKFALRHCANSGVVINYPKMALDMVRPGLLLYGYGDGGKLGLRPAMSLITTVSTIKIYEAGTKISYGGIYETSGTARIGVLPIGYADGLMRCLSGKCSFYTEEGAAAQIGRICMDMCMVDLTGKPGVNIESRVEIFGKNNSLDELSYAAGTIPYELMCSVSKRVPRVYC